MYNSYCSICREISPLNYLLLFFFPCRPGSSAISSSVIDRLLRCAPSLTAVRRLSPVLRLNRWLCRCALISMSEEPRDGLVGGGYSGCSSFLAAAFALLNLFLGRRASGRPGNGLYAGLLLVNDHPSLCAVMLAAASDVGLARSFQLRTDCDQNPLFKSRWNDSNCYSHCVAKIHEVNDFFSVAIL